MKVEAEAHRSFPAVTYVHIQEDWTIVSSSSIKLFERPNTVYITIDKDSLRLHIRFENVDAAIGLATRKSREDEVEDQLHCFYIR